MSVLLDSDERLLVNFNKRFVANSKDGSSSSDSSEFLDKKTKERITGIGETLTLRQA